MRCSGTMSRQLSAGNSSKYGLDKFAYKPRQFGRDEAPFGLNVENIPVLSEILQEEAGLLSSAVSLFKTVKAKGTVSNYENTVKKFELFCAEKAYEYPGFNDKAVLHWVLHLNSKNAALSTLCNVKPALVLVEKLTGSKESAFTSLVDTLLNAAKRGAAERRPAIKKAPVLPTDMLQKMYFHVLGGFRCDNLSKLDLSNLRTLTRITVVYYTFCRLNCYNNLQARDFEEKDGSIMITFRKAKNDQMHKGSETFLVANDTTCPVYLTKLYFSICGLKFGALNDDSSYVNAVQKKSKKGVVTVCKDKQLKYEQSTKKLQQLVDEMGLKGKGVTDKSFKMLGVTRALENGITLDEAMTHGRWRTLSMPLHYKVNSELYKKKVASKVPS